MTFLVGSGIVEFVCLVIIDFPIFTQIIGFSWTLGFIIIGINVYFLSSKLVGWILHNSLPIYANILVGLTLFPLMLLYVAAVIYLTFRKDTAKFVSRRELQDNDDTEKAKVANQDGSEDNKSQQSN
jgi:manganese transport protein